MGIAPTKYPTSKPTPAPTEYPTAYPTSTPTAYPTLANCDGKWKFMSKVYGNKASDYNIPLYTKGVTYNLNNLATGSCKAIETSHQTTAGTVQTIKHNYKCCRDGVYGSVAIDTSSVAATDNLCGANTDKSLHQHCSLFGPNMYDITKTDPSSSVDGKEKGHVPTAFPTAHPTHAPTTYPTAYPTETPTAY